MSAITAEDHGTSAPLPGEPPHAHHWEPENAYGGAKLAMWLFLATEILLFGVLFTAFAIFRYAYLEEFHHASLKLDWVMGSINTAVLILSSFTAALAVDAGQKGDNKKVYKLLVFTIFCGFCFLGIKYFEYSHKYHSGVFPGVECTADVDYCWPSDPSSVEKEFKDKLVTKKYKMYFGLYYCMTGLHALHIIIGMAVLGWVAWLARRNRFSERYYTPVELSALYWHLVDLIWIYLFPLLYLVD